MSGRKFATEPNYGSFNFFGKLQAIKVVESYDVCIDVQKRYRCMSRLYVNNQSPFTRIKQVLGNGRCEICWDRTTDDMYN